MAWHQRHDTISGPQICDISTVAGHLAGALAGARRILGVDFSAQDVQILSYITPISYFCFEGTVPNVTSFCIHTDALYLNFHVFGSQTILVIFLNEVDRIHLARLLYTQLAAASGLHHPRRSSHVVMIATLRAYCPRFSSYHLMRIPSAISPPVG